MIRLGIFYWQNPAMFGITHKIMFKFEWPSSTTIKKLSKDRRKEGKKERKKERKKGEKNVIYNGS